MPASDNLKFMKSVLKLQKVLEQCEENKEASAKNTNEATRYSGYFGGQGQDQELDSPAGTLLSRQRESQGLGSIHTKRQKEEQLTADEFFRKVPDFSLHFDELTEYFRSDLERNEDNFKLLKLHKEFEIKTKKMVNVTDFAKELPGETGHMLTQKKKFRV